MKKLNSSFSRHIWGDSSETEYSQAGVSVSRIGGDNPVAEGKQTCSSAVVYGTGNYKTCLLLSVAQDLSGCLGLVGTGPEAAIGRGSIDTEACCRGVSHSCDAAWR